MSRLALMLTLPERSHESLLQIWDQVLRVWVQRRPGALLFDLGDVFCSTWFDGNALSSDAAVFGGVLTVIGLALAGLLFIMALDCTTPRTRAGRSMSTKCCIAALVLLPLLLAMLGAMMAVSQFWPMAPVCAQMFAGQSTEPPWPPELPIKSGDSHFELFGDTDGDQAAGARLQFVRAWQLPSSVALDAFVAHACHGGDAVLPTAWHALAVWFAERALQCDVTRGAHVQLRIGHPLFSVHHISQLVTAPHGQALVELTEAHAAVHGWTTARHSHYATTDVPVATMPEVLAFMHKHGINERIHSMLAAAFSIPWPIHSRDQFIVKYEASAQASLDFHQDGGGSTIVSYNVLLNSPRDFEGGGTTFRAFHKHAVAIKQGDAASHPSKLFHGGGLVTNGTRYILVGFVELKTPLGMASRLVTHAGDYLSVFFPDSYRYLQSLENTREFQNVLGAIMTTLVALIVTLFWCENRRLVK